MISKSLFRLSLLPLLLLQFTLQTQAAQVHWSEPTVVYDDQQYAYENASRGVHLARDSQSNVMAVWARSGSPGKPNVSIVFSLRSAGQTAWGTPEVAAISAPGGNSGDARVVWASSNTWLIFWSVETDNGSVDIYYTATSNRGASWSAPTLLANHQGATWHLGAAHQALDVNGQGNGVLVLTYMSDLYISRDSGQSWVSQPASDTLTTSSVVEARLWSRIAPGAGQKWVHAFQRSTDPAGVSDVGRIYVQTSDDNCQSWSAPVSLPREGVRLSNLSVSGAMAAIALNAYEAPAPGGRPQLMPFISRSTDSGVSWSTPERIEQVNCIPVVHLNGISTLVMLIDQSANGYLWTTESIFGSKEWSPVDVIAKEYVPGNIIATGTTPLISAEATTYHDRYQRDISVLNYPGGPYEWQLIHRESQPDYILAEPTTARVAASESGVLVATWSIITPVRNRIVAAVSTNYGYSWSAPKLLFEISNYDLFGGSTYSLPVYLGEDKWLVVLGDGFGLHATFSTDGGQTWSQYEIRQSAIESFEIMGVNRAGTLVGKMYGREKIYWRSDDNFDTFTLFGIGEDYGDAVVTLGGNNWLKVDDGNAYVSTDNCHNWLLRGSVAGLQNATNVVAACSPDIKTVLVAASFTAPDSHIRIFKTVDYGETWSEGEFPVAEVAPGKSLTLKWWSNNTWLVGYGTGMQGDAFACSTDDGATWTTAESDRFGASFETGSGRAMTVFGSADGPLKLFSSNARIPGSTAASDWQLYN